MNKLGTLHIGQVSSHDFIPDDPQAVATIFIYGPQGALKTTQLIDKETATKACRDLSELAGLTAQDVTLDSLSSIIVRMRRDANELKRRMRSGELPNKFMDGESFTMIDLGLSRFEYYASKKINESRAAEN